MFDPKSIMNERKLLDPIPTPIPRNFRIQMKCQRAVLS